MTKEELEAARFYMNLAFAPKMTEEVANKEGVVAAMCCEHCSHFEGRNHGSGVCKRLKCQSFSTDICKNYHGNNED